MTGVTKKVTIEATGGHHELGVLISYVHKAVAELRGETRREYINYGQMAVAVHNFAPINLEGTIRVETEDDL